MQKTFIAFVISSAFAAAQTITSDMVIIRGGTVEPAPARAAIEELVTVIVHPLLNQYVIDAAGTAGAIVTAAVEAVQSQIDAQESVGFIRGFVSKLGAMEAAVDTNAAVSIVRFDVDQLDGGGRRCWIYAAFSGRNSAQNAQTDIQFSASLQPVTWAVIPSVESYATNIMINGEWLDTVCYIVEIPAIYNAAFMRVQATLEKVGLPPYLEVRNGIRVNDENPFTGEIVAGTNLIKFVGGVRVSGLFELDVRDALPPDMFDPPDEASPPIISPKSAMAQIQELPASESVHELDTPEKHAAIKTKVQRLDLTPEEVNILMDARKILKRLRENREANDVR